jgi:hypothetical protein
MATASQTSAKGASRRDGIDCNIHCDSLPQAALDAVFRGRSERRLDEFCEPTASVRRIPSGFVPRYRLGAGERRGLAGLAGRDTACDAGSADL